MAKKVWTPAARRAFAEKMRKARAAKGSKRTRRANPGRSYHNIEKLPGKDYYTGYADGPWEIRKTNSSYGSWIARKKSDPSKTIYAFGLKSMSEKLEALNRPTHPNPGRAAVHTKKFDRTVRKVKRSLKRRGAKGNAYAIAESTLGEKRSIRKAHRRRNPSQHFVIGVRKPSGPFFYVPKDHRNVLVKDYARAHRFPNLRSAQAVGQHVARLAPRGYQVGVYRA